MKRTPNDAARRHLGAEGQHLDCSASMTQGAYWDSLQVSAFKNNDSWVLGQTGTAAHCQEVSSRDSCRGSYERPPMLITPAGMLLD